MLEKSFYEPIVETAVMHSSNKNSFSLKHFWALENNRDFGIEECYNQFERPLST